MGAIKDELQEYLDGEDLGEFERNKSQVQVSFNPNPLASHELFNLRAEKANHLASSPPVKLYVSKVPPGLTEQGLRNIFIKYGELRDVSRPMHSKQSEFFFAFVSFSNRREALRAIENVSERAPMFLEVQFSLDEKEAQRQRLMNEAMEKFNQNINLPIYDEEEDWDKEIEDNKKMQAAVDQFMEDEKGEDSASEIGVEKEGVSNNSVSGAIKRSNGSTDSSGIEVYFEANLPEADLKNNPHATIQEMDNRWAVVRFSGLQREKQFLENTMKSKSTEVLRSPPRAKQLCVFERKGKFARVIIDTVGESGLKFHGVDDGTRVKLDLDDWKTLRYLPSSLLQLAPHCVTVRLNSPPPPETETVKIIYLADKKGYPVVELIGVSSDILSQTSESNKTIDDLEVETKESDNNSNKQKEFTNPESQVVSTNSKVTRLEVGDTIKLRVTHVVSPREVYFIKDKEKFYQLCLKINQKAQALIPSPTDFTPEVGSLVFAKAKDKIWYRAEVLSIDGPRFTYYAVDFGFIDNADLDEAREIPDDSFKTTNYLAVKCVLKDWVEGTLPPSLKEIKDIKKKLPLDGRSVKVKVIEGLNDSYIVDINNISRDAGIY